MEGFEQTNSADSGATHLIPALTAGGGSSQRPLFSRHSGDYRLHSSQAPLLPPRQSYRLSSQLFVDGDHKRTAPGPNPLTAKDREDPLRAYSAARGGTSGDRTLTPELPGPCTPRRTHRSPPLSLREAGWSASQPLHTNLGNPCPHATGRTQTALTSWDREA